MSAPVAEGSAGEHLHRNNEVLPTNHSQSLTLECNPSRPGEGGDFEPPQADERLDAISKLVSRLQQRPHGVICIAAPESVSRPELPFAGLSLPGAAKGPCYSLDARVNVRPATRRSQSMLTPGTAAIAVRPSSPRMTGSA